MVTVASAPAAPQLRPAGKRRKLRGVEDYFFHAIMWLAMVPCLIGGNAVAHGSALFALLAASAWISIRVRQNHPRDAQLVDLLTMSMLSLAAMLSHPAMGVSVHDHGVHRDGSPATIIALVSVFAWILLRGVHWDHAASWRAAIASATMVSLMLGSVLLATR